MGITEGVVYLTSNQADENIEFSRKLLNDKQRR